MKDPKNIKTFKKSRKEALYVVFFLCLCAVVTISAITFKNNKIAKQQALEKERIEMENQAKKNEKNPNITLVDDSAKNEKQYENSLEVKNNKKDQTAANLKKNNKELKVSSSVSNGTFVKPVAGVIGREYSDAPVYWESVGTYTPNFGIDIKTDLGKSVVASSAGVVVEVGENKNGFGKQVVIDHKNGLKTVYANLSEKISVKKNQKVKQGEKIGEVGNTTLKSFNEKYGSNLHFEMLKDDQNINPAKYIKY